MRLITDFHLHSKWSRACSKQLTIRSIAATCERKGIQCVGTADFTHPAWIKEIKTELEEIGEGVLRLKRTDSQVCFFLTTELSCIYKRAGKTRRVHHLVFFPSLASVDRFSRCLVARGCNLKADGRPILGLDSEELLKIIFDTDPKGLLIPAHAWTPWFGIFGSQSGFDSMEECFGEMTKYVTAIETGLSSDPGMNHRVSALDDLLLVSNSDAHSLDNLGREATAFEMPYPSYDEFHRIITRKDRSKLLETIEFFPEKGKYYADGHRLCGFRSLPKQTKRLKGICSVCGKPLTIGVMNRIEALADRTMTSVRKMPQTVSYRSMIPLAELIAEALHHGVKSKICQREVDRLLADGRSEFFVLLDMSRAALERCTRTEIVRAIFAVRTGNISIRPGYDGEYGKISFDTYQKSPESLDSGDFLRIKTKN